MVCNNCGTDAGFSAIFLGKPPEKEVCTHLTVMLEQKIKKQPSAKCEDCED